MTSSGKRVVAFVDGQNLFKCAQSAGYCTTPDYDPRALAAEICRRKSWTLCQVRFYTGIPDSKRASRLFQAWQSKIDRMTAQGIMTCTRPLRYDAEGKAREKGIDVRIALDIVRLGNKGDFDVCLIFSQDQDLKEAVHELRDIANEQGRKILIASAYVAHPGSKYATRGIYDTDWIAIDELLYDATREAVPFYSAH